MRNISRVVSLLIILAVLAAASACSEINVSYDKTALANDIELHINEDAPATDSETVLAGDIEPTKVDNASASSGDAIPAKKSTGKIYLYGEVHGEKKIIDKEFELWHGYYHNENMRHLFIEIPYYEAEFLNIWMKSGNDVILEQLFESWKGSSMYDTERIFQENKSRVS